MPKTDPNITVTVVVSGQETSLKVNIHQKVEELVREALRETGNQGQPPEDWELRTGDGALIGQGIRIADAGIVATQAIVDVSYGPKALALLRPLLARRGLAAPRVADSAAVGRPAERHERLAQVLHHVDGRLGQVHRAQHVAALPVTREREGRDS